MGLQHSSIVGIVDLVLWLDRRFQKPASIDLPEFDDLWVQPSETLKTSAFTIGPHRRYVSALVFSALLALPIALGVLLISVAILDPRKGPLAKRDDSTLILAGILGVVLIVLIATFRLTLWLYSGGRMVITIEGVQLWNGRNVVHCPWDLFDSDEEPHESRANAVRIPVALEGINHTELRRNSQLIARGRDIRCRQLRFRTDGEMLLGDIYSAQGKSLAELLLHIGRELA